MREESAVGNMNELKDLRPKPVWNGVSARAVEGDRITLSVVEMEPETLVPEHTHENEQIGVLLSGSLLFTIDGEQRQFGPGGTWRILGNVPHEAKAGPEGAVVVEAFSPIRDDWHAIEDDDPQQPVWP
jgi:quercetin dioxygenase-like cupin family protein